MEKKRRKKRINGKIYTSYGSYKNPSIPLREARGLRNEGWNARVVKEGSWHTLFRRKTPRTLKWSANRPGAKGT